MRADHLGCYGATDVQTPTLDGLARDGIVFERAISQVPLTWPSHAAILTGTYPFQNGVQDFTGQPLDERFRSVAQVFKQQGYATGAVVSAFVLDRSWGLARGFDFYDDAFSAETFQPKRHRTGGSQSRRECHSCAEWLNDGCRKRRDDRFSSGCICTIPTARTIRRNLFAPSIAAHPYDGEIAYADHELGRLIAWLKQNQLYDRSLIVLLSDHGESLGEHGEKEHGFFVYNSTVHIPLIVKPPAGSGFRPGRVARPVETVAVAPTLTRLAGMKDDNEKQFQSPGLLGEEATSVMTPPTVRVFIPSVRSAGARCTLWRPAATTTSRRRPELYDVVADPEEKNNLAPQQTCDGRRA